MNQDEMTQNERLLYLIEQLLQEDGGRSGDSLGLSRASDGRFLISDDGETRQKVLRALMNIRGPYPVGDRFLEVQDAYLQQRNAERGVTELSDLQPSVRNGKLYLWQGDITTLAVDGIVNAANSALLGCFAPLHTCIDNCIHTYAGIQLRRACNEIMEKQGKEEGTGLCKITPAFNLPSKYVLHTVGPIISTVVTVREKLLLADCYTHCLETAADYGLESVAFCCISTGVFRFPADLAARIAVETVETWLAENNGKSIQHVVFNVFGDKDRELYEKLLER